MNDADIVRDALLDSRDDESAALAALDRLVAERDEANQLMELATDAEALMKDRAEAAEAERDRLRQALRGARFEIDEWLDITASAQINFPPSATWEHGRHDAFKEAGFIIDRARAALDGKP